MDCSGSDDKMAAILEAEEGDGSVHPGDDWWRVLDDAGMFDFGDDTEHVFDALPELPGHRGQHIRRGLSEGEVAGFRKELAQFNQ